MLAVHPRQGTALMDCCARLAGPVVGSNLRGHPSTYRETEVLGDAETENCKLRRGRRMKLIGNGAPIR
jgi:hypothetical protein